MNLVKKSEFALRLKWLPMNTQARSIRNIFLSRLLHRKSLPPLVKKKEAKELEEAGKSNNETQASKIQRDIFGATILPQNLSFENAKRLSDNQVRLEDIPLVDESEAAEELAAEKMKTDRCRVPKSGEPKGDSEVTEKDISKETEKSLAELFWIADPFEAIPGPRIFGKFKIGLKQLVRQITIFTLFRFLRASALTPFKVYGPIVKVPEILGGKIILISRPEHIEAIFEQDKRFPTNSVLDSIQRSRSLRRNKNQPVTYHLTEEWNNVKKKINEPLMRDTEKYFDGIDEAAEKLVRRIKIIRNGQNEVPENFLFEINKWSLECLCYLIFDKSFGFLDYDSANCPSKTSQLLYSLTAATKSICHLESGFQFWRFMKTTSLSSLGSACDILESIISEYVGQVQLNLIKKKENAHNGRLENVSVIENLLVQEKISPNDIICTVLDTLLIGMNTMSTALGFLFYYLSTNPRAQAGAWKEIKGILPEKYSRLEYEHLGYFKYIQACLMESLRLKMPMPTFSRILKQNVTVSNYQIPKGTLVLMMAQAECLKKDNFDDPAEFLPERWLEPGVSHPFASLPLGNYFEDSLERRLAEISVWVCASLVLRHFTVDYMYEEIDSTGTVISFPNKPLKFTFVDRKI